MAAIGDEDGHRVRTESRNHQMKIHFNSFCRNVAKPGLFTPVDEFSSAAPMPGLRSAFARPVSGGTREKGQAGRHPEPNPKPMRKIHHTYVTPDDPVAHELLARIMEWSTAIPQSFNVVVAYDDIHAARRAKEICDRVRQRIGGPIAFEIHLWRFDVLRMAELRDTAAKDATQAHLIIVATAGEGNLPGQLENWVEIWLSERLVRDGALILLLEPAQFLSSIRETPEYEYLKRIAQRARMQFFASCLKAPKSHRATIGTAA